MSEVVHMKDKDGNRKVVSESLFLSNIGTATAVLWPARPQPSCSVSCPTMPVAFLNMEKQDFWN